MESSLRPAAAFLGLLLGGRLKAQGREGGGEVNDWGEISFSRRDGLCCWWAAGLASPGAVVLRWNAWVCQELFLYLLLWCGLVEMWVFLLFWFFFSFFF